MFTKPYCHTGTLLKKMELQKFLGRRTRTSLPTTAALLQPRVVDPDTHKTMKRIKNAKSAVYYDRYSKDLEALEEGDVVRMKPMTLGNKTWKERGDH